MFDGYADEKDDDAQIEKEPTVFPMKWLRKVQGILYMS
jgi:hypothetical protein